MLEFLDKDRKLLEGSELAGAKFSVMIFLYIILACIVQAIIEPLKGSNAYYCINGLIAPLAILLALIIFKREDGSFLNKLNVSKTEPINYLFAVVLFMAIFFLFGDINGLIANIFKKWGIKTSSIEIDVITFKDLILFTITLAIVPAIAEELFFRGSILTDLYGDKKWCSYIVVGFLFAIYHCSLTQFLYQFIYGFLLSALTDKSKSVLPAIIAHFLNNFVVLLMEYFKVESLSLLLFIKLGLGVIFMGSLLFYLIYNAKEKRKERAELGKVFILYGFFGIVICILLILVGLVV